MLRLKSLQTLVSAICIAAPLMAQASAPIYLWDNEEGFIAGMSCEITPSDRNPFRASQYYSTKRGDKKPTENLRNYKGVRQSYLVNHSLVKVINKRRKRNTLPIEVVGANTRTRAKTNRWNSQRGDRGYLHNNSLRPIEDFVFEVSLKEENIKNITDAGLSLDKDKKIFLRAASGASYFRGTCDNTNNREYILFRAYQKENSEKAIFYAGVSAEETSVFEKLRTYGKVETMGFLKEVGQEAPLTVVEIESLVVTAAPSVEDEIMEMEASNDELSELANQAELVEKEEVEKEVVVSDQAPKTSLRPVPRPPVKPPVQKRVSLQNLICTDGNTLNVRNESLDRVVFKAKIGEKITVFQSFDDSEDLNRTINGKRYVFKKVEFKEREQSDQRIGYVAESFIKTEGACPALKEIPSIRLTPATKITGLNDKNCCDFPTEAKPTHSYTSGMRRFRAGRSGGRLHAACDLYRYRNEPARSVAPGVVISDLYYFYQGTYALEVRHDGGFIVRYGEITSKRYTRRGRRVKMGQRIGNIGVVNSGCCRPMLHFELYSGKKKGALSTGKGRYKRRSDLMDPTPYLLKWQDKVF